jgi:molybdenum cofactor cytidylyltransferase
MIGGLVLAAGEGTRFGPEPKLLAELGGRPLLEHAVRAQCLCPAIDRVVVVLGARAEEIRRRVDFMRAEPVVCELWAEGQSASLRLGATLLEGAEKVVVTLGDQPLMTPEVIALLADQPAGTRATYDGRPGHPVVLGREHLRTLRSLTGDRGARDRLSGVRTIECSALAPYAGCDVDTPQDLEAIREARAVV